MKRFKEFCKAKDATEYSFDIGKLYADDVISKKIGNFSLSRYHIQGRFIRLIDSYFNIGEFDFSMLQRGRITPDNPNHKVIYEDYQKYLRSIYDNENTIHFYEYGMYCVLQFLNRFDIYDMNELQTSNIFQYLKETKQIRQREVLSELRSILDILKETIS